MLCWAQQWDHIHIFMSRTSVYHASIRFNTFKPGVQTINGWLVFPMQVSSTSVCHNTLHKATRSKTQRWNLNSFHRTQSICFVSSENCLVLSVVPICMHVHRTGLQFHFLFVSIWTVIRTYTKIILSHAYHVSFVNNPQTQSSSTHHSRRSIVTQSEPPSSPGLSQPPIHAACQPA